MGGILCHRPLWASTAWMAFLVCGLSLGFCQTSPVGGGSAAVYRVAGRVVSKADGRPLARARVLLTDAKDRRKSETTFSAEEGKFEFTGVPAGKYSLEGASRGFLPAAYDQHDQFSTAIVTGAGLDTENLTLRLSPTAIITGTVRDEAGDPVRHAQVMLYWVNHGAGVKRVQVSRTEQTNDLGSFEFANLASGTYYVGAHATPWYQVHPGKVEGGAPAQVDPALEVAYPITYYGDTADTDAAAPIAVRDGGRIEADIHLSPVPALRVVVQLTDVTRDMFPTLLETGLDGEPHPGAFPGGTRKVSPGVWEITGVPAGRYKIMMPNASGPARQSTTFDLVDDGQRVEASAPELSSLRVSLHVAGQTSVPRGLNVFLRSDRDTIQRWQPIDEAGEARPLEIPPGRYEVMVGGTEKAYSVARISPSGCEVSGQTVNLSSGPAAISLTVVEGAALVEGVVKQGDKPLAGAMVVLVPKDPAANRSLFRRDQSDLDGTFALNSVSPGSYTVVAIQDGWDLDWADPQVISAYVQRGQSVRIRDQQTRRITLSQPVDSQPR